MKRMRKNGQKGFSLVEVLITLAIFSLVLLLGYNLIFQNLTIFDRGEARSGIQFDVRMASDYVTRELRNVRNISFTDDGLPSKLNRDVLQDRYSNITEFTFSVERTLGDYFIEYEITGTSPRNNTQYTVETKVLLNNIRSFPDFDDDIEPDENNPTIYYRKQN